MSPEPIEIGKPPLDDTLVRTTAEEVRVTARRAHRIEIALVSIAATLMVLVAGFTGYNTYRLRDVNRNLTTLVETIEANQEAQQTYNEAHATSSGDNFAALIENIRCFTSFFELATRTGTPPGEDVLDACFKLPSPSPPPAKLPSEEKDR